MESFYTEIRNTAKWQLISEMWSDLMNRSDSYANS